jgi:hypothetical protein
MNVDAYMEAYKNGSTIDADPVEKAMKRGEVVAASSNPDGEGPSKSNTTQPIATMDPVIITDSPVRREMLLRMATCPLERAKMVASPEKGKEVSPPGNGLSLFDQLSTLQPLSSRGKKTPARTGRGVVRGSNTTDTAVPVEITSDPPLLWFAIEDAPMKSSARHFTLSEFAKLNTFDIKDVEDPGVSATLLALYRRENQVISLPMPVLDVEDECCSTSLYGSLALVGIRSARVNNCIAALVAIQSERSTEAKTVDAYVLSVFQSKDLGVDPSTWKGTALDFEVPFCVLSKHLKSMMRVHDGADHQHPDNNLGNRAFMTALFDARRLPKISSLEASLFQKPSLIKLEEPWRALTGGHKRKHASNGGGTESVEYIEDRGEKTADFQNTLSQHVGVEIGGGSWICDAWVEVGVGKRPYSKFCVEWLPLGDNTKKMVSKNTTQKKVLEEMLTAKEHRNREERM